MKPRLNERILPAAAPDDWRRPPGQILIRWLKMILYDLKLRYKLSEAVDMCLNQNAGCEWYYAFQKLITYDDLL